MWMSWVDRVSLQRPYSDVDDLGLFSTSEYSDVLLLSQVTESMKLYSSVTSLELSYDWQRA